MENKYKPLIGITCGISEKGIEGSYPHASIPVGFFQALRIAGAYGVAIPPMYDENVLDRLDGLIFTGGTDIEPSLYKQTRKSYTDKPDTARDRFEYNLLLRALNLDIPVLGICRGGQLLNITFGGTLYQDILKESPYSKVHNVIPEQEFAHEIKFVNDSKLTHLSNNKLEKVNSKHHQAIQILGEGLKIIAVASDNLVEAIESTQHRWVIGVQWHPEMIINENNFHQRIFNSFVEAAKSKVSIL